MQKIDNEYVIEKVKKYKQDFYAEYLTDDLSDEIKSIRKSFIDMGSEVSMKILLEFTIPIYQKVDQNTKFVKNVMKVAGSIVGFVFTGLGIALLNSILNS